MIYWAGTAQNVDSPPLSGAGFPGYTLATGGVLGSVVALDN